MFREDRRVACDKVRISLIILDATALGAVLLITTGVMLIFVRPVRLIYYIRAVLYTTHIIVCMVVHLCHVTIAVCRRCTHFSVVLAHCSLLGWVTLGRRDFIDTTVRYFAMSLKPVSHQPCGSRALVYEHTFWVFLAAASRPSYVSQGRKAVATSYGEFSTCSFSLRFSADVWRSQGSCKAASR